MRRKHNETEETCLQAALAGAGGLHVGLVTFLLADSALHRDTSLHLAHVQVNIGRGVGLIITSSRRGSEGDDGDLVDGGPERLLREQPACHQREVVCHSRTASEHAGAGDESTQSCGQHAALER
jgi:hypothetical protein